MAANKEFGSPTLASSTVIGPSITISGKISGDEDLVVRGRVEGELALTRTLMIEPSGIVKAEVSVKNAIVSGVVVGNITASESVEITKEGRMVGDIRAPRVIIVDGASFRGRVDMGDASAQRAVSSERAVSKTPVRAVVRAPVARPGPGSQAKVAKPVPPPLIVRAEKITEKSTESRSDQRPPAPPAPPLIAAVAKKKVVIKRKR